MKHAPPIDLYAGIARILGQQVRKGMHLRDRCRELSVLYGQEQARGVDTWQTIKRPKRTRHGQGRGRRIRAAKYRRAMRDCERMYQSDRIKFQAATSRLFHKFAEAFGSGDVHFQMVKPVRRWVSAP